MSKLAKFGKSALEIIKRVAPTVATGLGGPLAGMVTQTLMSAMGSDDPAHVEELLLSGNPEALAQLRQAEGDLKVRMRELDITEEQLHSEDRQSARDMAAKLGSIAPQLILTFLAIGAFATVLYVLVLQATIIPPENKDLVIFLVGQLSTFVGMGYSFFLGSSKGSKDKTAAMGAHP